MNVDVEQMQAAVEEACALLKALANEDRLLILCNLATGEKNVSELQELLATRQPTLSQQLSRLRLGHLVEPRRSGKEVYYRIESEAAARVLELLYEIYCPKELPRDHVTEDDTSPAPEPAIAGKTTALRAKRDRDAA